MKRLKFLRKCKISYNDIDLLKDEYFSFFEIDGNLIIEDSKRERKYENLKKGKKIYVLKSEFLNSSIKQFKKFVFHILKNLNLNRNSKEKILKIIDEYDQKILKENFKNILDNDFKL